MISQACRHEHETRDCSASSKSLVEQCIRPRPMRTWRRFKVKERQRLNCVQRFQKWKYDDSDTSYTMQIEYRTSNREDDLYDLMTVFLTLTRHEKTQNRSETILALNGYRWTNEKTRYVSFDTLESIIKQMSTTIRQIVHAAPVV